MECKCGDECSKVEDYPLIPYTIWHCDKCDIDFYCRDDSKIVIIS